jgi:hypothetical protein
MTSLGPQALDSRLFRVTCLGAASSAKLTRFGCVARPRLNRICERLCRPRTRARDVVRDTLRDLEP